MVKIDAHNESEAAEMLFKQDIDIGVFFHAFCRMLETTISSSQAKAVVRVMDSRYSRKAVLDTWRDRGELYTVKECRKEIADKVKETLSVDFGSFVENIAEKRGCDTRIDGPFIREFGEIYFNNVGKRVIITELQLKKPEVFGKIDDLTT